jgi:hypothetical protein
MGPIGPIFVSGTDKYNITFQKEVQNGIDKA